MRRNATIAYVLPCAVRVRSSIEIDGGKAGLPIRCPACEANLDVPPLSELCRYVQVTRTISGRPFQVPLRVFFWGMVPYGFLFVLMRWLGVAVVLAPLIVAFSSLALATVLGSLGERSKC